jgi:hypothetical protein
MLVGNQSINEKFFEGWSFDQFEEYYNSSGLKSCGLKAEQLAKKLGIVKEKVEKEPSK